MRNVCTILLLFLFPGCLKAKPFINEMTLPNVVDTIPATEDMFICQIPIEASCTKEWTTYLLKNLALDDVASDTIPAGCYTAIIRFVVESSGKISDVVIVKDPGYGLGKKAANVVSKYKGIWTPAMLNGRPTFSYRKQPITFIIEEEEEEEEECTDKLPTELIL